MILPDPDEWFWLATAAGELAVLVLAVVRRLWRRLPCFTAYLCLLATIEGVRWAVRVRAGVSSNSYAWAYWRTQEMLLAARAAALGDICRASLISYPGVWRLAQYLLVGGACALLLLANVHTVGTPGITSYFMFVERELEVAAVAILVLLLLLSRYYGVALRRPLRGIILGLVIYSLCVVLTTSVFFGRLALDWPAVSSLRVLAFLVALLLWAHALWLPPEAAEPTPLTPQAEFEYASGALDQRMHELNAKLVQFLKR